MTLYGIVAYYGGVIKTLLKKEKHMIDIISKNIFLTILILQKNAC